MPSKTDVERWREWSEYDALALEAAWRLAREAIPPMADMIVQLVDALYLWRAAGAEPAEVDDLLAAWNGEAA